MSYDFAAATDSHIQTAANAQLTKANALFKQQEVEQAQKEQELNEKFFAQGQDLNTGTPQAPEESNAPRSRSAKFMQYAEYMFAGGAPARAKDAAELAIKMSAEERAQQDQVYDTQKKQLEVEKASADFVDRMIGSAKNQSEYEYGLDQIMQSDYLSDADKAEMSRAMPKEWSPEVSRFWRDKAMDAKERAALAEQGADNERAERFHSDALAVDNARLTLERIRVNEAKRVREIAERTGKTAGAPNDQELETARAAVANTYGLDVETNEGKAAAAAIASRAKDILKDNIGINWDTALQRSMMEAEKDGDLTRGQEDTSSWYQSDNSKPASFGKQGSHRNPLQVPTTKDGKFDTGSMEAGKFYNTTKYGIVKWNGEGFEVEE